MTSAVTAQLILIQGDSDNFQRVIDLHNSNVTIGRAQTCNIMWGSLQISRRHCALEYVISKWHIRDTSTNGLSVNGNKLVKGDLFPLNDTDIISFIPTGTVRYRFKYVHPNSPSRLLPLGHGQSSSISPQPSTSVATPSTSRLAESRAVSSVIDIGSDNHSDSDDSSNHSESLLSLGNHEEYFFSFSGDEPAQSSEPDADRDESPAGFSKRKHKGDSSDSDVCAVDRKKKKMQFISSSDDENSRGSVSEKSDVPTASTSSPFKQSRFRSNDKYMTEDQISKCEDLEELKEHLKSCVTKLSSTEVRLKALELQRNMEKEELRRKENDVRSVNAAFKEETYKKMLELIESELSCSVCNEIFIQATVIDCGHTFCSFCINEWARKKQECPICRKAFRNRSRHIEVENFITRMFDSFSSEVATRRKVSIKDREDQVKKAAEDAARAETENQARGGGNFHAFIQTTAERYVDFLAELHQINEILAPRPTSRNNSADRRRSARIQERVVDPAPPGAQGSGRGRHRGRVRNPIGPAAVANNGHIPLPVQPQPMRAPVPLGGFRGVQDANINQVPVVTLNDSVDEGAAAAGPLRFPNQFINYVRRLPVPQVNLVDFSSRNRDGPGPSSNR